MKHSLQAALVAAIILLAGSMAWLAFGLVSVSRQIPEMMTRVDAVNTRVDAVVSVIPLVTEAIPPLLDEVAEVRKVLPSVLAEVGSVRGTVDGVVKEAGQIRAEIPAILSRVDRIEGEIARIEKALPDILKSVDGASSAVNRAATQVKEALPRVDGVVAEAQAVRHALPTTLDRVEEIVADAHSIGTQASQGAVTGVVKGIITSPFRLLADAGESITGIFRGSSDMTADDEVRMQEAATLLLQEMSREATVWASPVSGNGGRITIERRYESGGRPCVELLFELKLKSGRTESIRRMACKGDEGNWMILEEGVDP